MTKKEYQKNLRNWRIKEIAMYLLGLALFALGIIVFIRSFLSGGVTIDAWMFILGFAIAAAGLSIFADAWNEKFEDYLKKKKTR